MNNDKLENIESRLNELEQKLTTASSDFKNSTKEQHRELSADFAATDRALEDLVQEVEKGDSNELSDEVV